MGPLSPLSAYKTVLRAFNTFHALFRVPLWLSLLESMIERRDQREFCFGRCLDGWPIVRKQRKQGRPHAKRARKGKLLSNVSRKRKPRVTNPPEIKLDFDELGKSLKRPLSAELQIYMEKLANRFKWSLEHPSPFVFQKENDDRNMRRRASTNFRRIAKGAEDIATELARLGS